MEFGRAFSFQFQDPDWIKKILLHALIGLIPIVGQFYLMGLGVEIARRVINNDPKLLPDIDFGGILGKGFGSFVIGLVYAIPLIIFTLPIYLVGPLGALIKLDDNTMGILMVIVSICCGGLALLYGIFMAFMMPAALGNYAAKGSIGAGLRFGEVFGLVKAAPVAYLLVVVGAIIGSFIAPLGGILCGIGSLLTVTYVNTMVGHLTGQAYLKATGQIL